MNIFLYIIVKCPNLHTRNKIVIDKEEYIDKALEIMATNDVRSKLNNILLYCLY